MIKEGSANWFRYIFNWFLPYEIYRFLYIFFFQFWFQFTQLTLMVMVALISMNLFMHWANQKIHRKTMKTMNCFHHSQWPNQLQQTIVTIIYRNELDQWHWRECCKYTFFFLSIFIETMSSKSIINIKSILNIYSSPYTQ